MTGPVQNITKSDYARFLQINADAPVYIQDWYLDLVCGSRNWDAAIVKRSEDVVAVLPYFIKKNRFFKWIAMPPLSKLHGPHILEDYRNNRHHHAIVDELIDQLPAVSFYQQAMDYSFKNWLPYLWKGYSQVTLYSYVFPIVDLDGIFRNIKTDIRRKIKLNIDRLFLKTGLPFDSFYEVFSKTYTRQGLKPPVAYDFLENYFQVLKARSSAELLFMIDSKDVIHSVAMLIWDKKACYYIIEGTDPAAPNKYSATMMKWYAIKYAKEVLNIVRFDCEGSISKRIERTYREFGATAEPYYVIKKYHSKAFLGLKFLQNYKQYGKLVQW